VRESEREKIIAQFKELGAGAWYLGGLSAD
jgi:hypothetical protein